MKQVIINYLITLATCIGQRVLYPEDGWPTLIEFVILFGLLTVYDEVQK